MTAQTAPVSVVLFAVAKPWSASFSSGGTHTVSWAPRRRRWVVFCGSRGFFRARAIPSAVARHQTCFRALMRMGGTIAPRRTRPQTDWVVMPNIAASSRALTCGTRSSIEKSPVGKNLLYHALTVSQHRLEFKHGTEGRGQDNANGERKMNKQHWIAIGTVVVLHNMGQKTFGMICDREQEKYGLAYTVLTDEHRFEKHFRRPVFKI